MASNNNELTLPRGMDIGQLLGSLAQQAQLGDQIITGDEVRFHADGSQYIVLPEGWTFSKAERVIARLKADQEKITRFPRQFNYRPNDGAVASANVMKRMFGMALGKTLRTFFGDKPPSTITVAIAHNKKITVPWGLVELPGLPGLQFDLGIAGHRDYGPIFSIVAEGPNRYRKQVEAFFEAVERELATNSIYRGQALSGANDLDFINLAGFDPTKIVFSTDVTDILEHALWGTLKHTSALELDDIAIKRALLLYGPYGTGKSSVGQITGQIATRNGWTTLISKPGDKVADVLRTARLYEPAVVFIEDIDTQASSGLSSHVTELLDVFDGIVAKDSKIVMVLTTNKVETIHKGLLRPGRVDYAVEVGMLDQPGVERLIKAVIPANVLDDNVDYDAVFAAADSFGPAFVKAVTTRAKTWALINNEGNPNYRIGTRELVGAAESLRPQMNLLNAAGEGDLPPTLDRALHEVIKETLERVEIQDADGDASYNTNRMVVLEDRPSK